MTLNFCLVAESVDDIYRKMDGSTPSYEVTPDKALTDLKHPHEQDIETEPRHSSRIRHPPMQLFSTTMVLCSDMYKINRNLG